MSLLRLAPLLVSLAATPAFASSNGLIASCNDGDLKVSSVLRPEGFVTHEAVISDAGVIDFFLAETRKTVKPNISGYPWGGEVLKKFPWSVKIEGEGNDRVLRITGLNRDSSDPREFSGSQHTGSLDAYDRGLRVRIEGSEMVGSHSHAFWVVGEWFFESCQYTGL